jgi:NDP-sugar pyrophosphorylase family protein
MTTRSPIQAADDVLAFPAAAELDLSSATAVILAGGLGTRLRSVLADRPKVLAEVDGRPFLLRLLDQLALAGVKHVVLCTGHRAEQVRAAVGCSHGPLEIEYSHEPAPAGTAGALRRALPLLRSSSVLALNGDSYCELDLNHFWIWHHLRPAHASLALTHVDDARRFGSVETGDYGRIVRFTEKSDREGPARINAGVYILRRALIARIPAGRTLSLESDVLPLWVDAGLYGYDRTGRFIDIGTPETLAGAARFFRRPGGRGAGRSGLRAPRLSRGGAHHHAEVA